MMDVKRAATMVKAVAAMGPDEALLAFPEALPEADPLVELVPLFCFGSAVSLYAQEEVVHKHCPAIGSHQNGLQLSGNGVRYPDVPLATAEAGTGVWSDGADPGQLKQVAKLEVLKLHWLRRGPDTTLDVTLSVSRPLQISLGVTGFWHCM